MPVSGDTRKVLNEQRMNEQLYYYNRNSNYGPICYYRYGKSLVTKWSIENETSRRKSFWKSPFVDSARAEWSVIVCDDDDDDDDEKIKLSKNHHYAYSSLNLKFGDCLLLNSISNETIQLPTLLPWIQKFQPNRRHGIHLHRCILTSPPPSAASGSMVFLFLCDADIDDDYNDDKTSGSSFNSYYLLIFCRPGDKHWRTHEDFPAKKGTIRTLICFNNKLYVIFYDDLIVEVGNFNDDNESEALLAIRQFDLHGCCHIPYETGIRSQTEFVKSNDQLFRVTRRYCPGSFYNEILQVLVFKMDFSTMTWEKVKSLGDHVLFISGNNITMSYSAVELGLTKGCVFYTMPPYNSNETLFKFDPEDNSIMVASHRLDLPPRPCLSPDWVVTTSTLTNIGKIRRRITTNGRGNNRDRNTKNIVVTTRRGENEMNGKCNGNESQLLEKNESGLEGLMTLEFLSEDLLMSLASFLHPLDYIHFRAICKANRSAIPARNWRISSKATSYLPPWLVFCKEDKAVYNFINPMHNNENYIINLSESLLAVNHSELLLGAKVRFSKGGWLFMSQGWKSTFFFNPFTKKIIHYKTTPFDQFKYYSFSCTPTSPDCLLFGINDDWSSTRISLVRNGELIFCNYFSRANSPNGEYKEFKPCRSNSIFFREAVYCLDRSGTLGVFDFKHVFNWNVLATPSAPCSSFTQCFLAECDEELLSIFIGKVGQWVQIFRLDHNNNWVKVESLGGYMLFISNTSCLSAVAPVSSGMENKVYFSRLHKESILYYSLDTNRYHVVGSDYSLEKFYGTKELLNCGWIEPNWSPNTDEELIWRHHINLKRCFW